MMHTDYHHMSTIAHAQRHCVPFSTPADREHSNGRRGRTPQSHPRTGEHLLARCHSMIPADRLSSTEDNHGVLDGTGVPIVPAPCMLSLSACNTCMLPGDSLTNAPLNPLHAPRRVLHTAITKPSWSTSSWEQNSVSFMAVPYTSTSGKISGMPGDTVHATQMHTCEIPPIIRIDSSLSAHAESCIPSPALCPTSTLVYTQPPCCADRVHKSQHTA